MAENKRVKFRIFRYNPETDREGRFQEMEVPVQPGWTVLDVLQYIKDEVDGTLTFRRSCRSGICGSCAMKINGDAKLACKTQVGFELEKGSTITVEPLGNMKQLKDLVTDFEGFWQKFTKVEPWLQPDESKVPADREIPQSQEEVDVIDRVADCIKCGSCFGDCTVLEADPDFLGPMALAQAFRFAADSRDAKKKERLSDLTRMGLWWCAHCYRCVPCPKQVKPAHAILALREMAIQEGLVNDPGVRHVQAFRESIVRYGKLNEAMLVLKTRGIFKQLTDFPQALAMMRKGKAKPPFKKPIRKIDDVRRVVKAAAGGVQK
ncbi:MAG: succinate dehydrogenase iron-sulfur subunit [Firmicutes bacterium]|nr:succinate dehydrogenase iron-sulfur subunit [Bacillota bacterium]